LFPSAASSLSVVVHEKAGTLDALKSFKLPLLQKVGCTGCCPLR
jgi:hypothetical protein